MTNSKEPASQEPGSKSQAGAIPETASKPVEKESFTPELIPAPVAKQPSEPKTGEDIEKLRRDYHELREKLNTVRENDILSLKEKTSDLNRKFGVAALIVLILGGLGVKQFFDLNRFIEESIKNRTEKAIEFNEKFIRASTMAGVGDFQNATPIYEELYAQKPEDEILFYRLLHALNQVERYKDAMPHIDRARKNGFLADKYKYFFSFNNAGYILLIESAVDSSLRPQAYELLRQAEEIGMKTGDDSVKFALINLATYHTMMGERDQARKYGQRYLHYEGENWVWRPWEGALLKRLVTARPNIVNEMKEALSRDPR